MNLNYDIIMPLDVVFCTSLKPVSLGIRIAEAGIKNTFNTKIATHVGIVVPLGGVDFRMIGIAEMLPDGLHISSFSRYLNKGFFGDRIVDIKRFNLFTSSPAISHRITKQIFKWWEEGKGYDWNGVLEHVLPFLKDKQGKFYCSEMLEWIAINIANGTLIPGITKDNVTPYDQQISPLGISVEGSGTK